MLLYLQKLVKNDVIIFGRFFCFSNLNYFLHSIKDGQKRMRDHKNNSRNCGGDWRIETGGI